MSCFLLSVVNNLPIFSPFIFLFYVLFQIWGKNKEVFFIGSRKAQHPTVECKDLRIGIWGPHMIEISGIILMKYLNKDYVAFWIQSFTVAYPLGIHLFYCSMLFLMGLCPIKWSCIDLNMQEYNSLHWHRSELRHGMVPHDWTWPHLNWHKFYLAR